VLNIYKTKIGNYPSPVLNIDRSAHWCWALYPQTLVLIYLCTEI